MNDKIAAAKRISPGVWLLRGIAIAILAGICISLYAIMQQTTLARRFATSRLNLRQLGIAVQNYHDVDECLVVSIRNSDGVELQNWQTILLPYILNPGPLYFERDRQIPWNAEVHRELFQLTIPWYLSPSMEHATDPVTGYGLTGYSANMHLINFGPAVKFDDIKDGLSTTLLIGEIRDEFPPWGKPGNSRDPALGINKSPKGFGGTFYNGCLFVMADGAVRHISEKVDTKVIEALGTPAGGEAIKEEDF